MPREMVVVPYDPDWVEAYRQEKEILTGIFQDSILEIHHFGSTSIPGICAKPIIDVMIVVADIAAVDELNSRMEDAGYSVRGENGIPERRYFVKLKHDGSGNHTHHIHVYQQGNRHIEDELVFPRYLRVNVEARLEYERVKLEASKRHRHSPMSYVEAKYECVMKLTAEAKAYFGTRDRE
jgi:GrpB-like predicted nucleotidyltransferase (UPF0157 family)